jgi:hypothetical protein
MSEAVPKAKAELRTLLEALGHTFVKRPYRKSPARRECWRLECESCGAEFFLRFSKVPVNGGERSVADFPPLGGRCASRQAVGG